MKNRLTSILKFFVATVVVVTLGGCSAKSSIPAELSCSSNNIVPESFSAGWFQFRFSDSPATVTFANSGIVLGGKVSKMGGGVDGWDFKVETRFNRGDAAPQSYDGYVKVEILEKMPEGTFKIRVHTMGQGDSQEAINAMVCRVN